MAKRGTRRSGGDAGLDDPYAWKGEEVKDKKSTGKKKRKKKRAAEAEEEAPPPAKARSAKSKKATGRSKRSTANASATASAARGDSARKSARKSSRSASEDGSASSARRRRALPAKKKGADPIVFISIITATLLICGGIVVVSRMGGTEVGKDEPALFDEAKALQEKGMRAFRDWNKAIRDGNGQLELEKHKEALDSLQASMAKLDEALEDHQNDPDYEGYDSMYQDLTQHIIDLEKGGRLR